VDCQSPRKRVLGRAQRPTFLVVSPVIDAKAAPSRSVPSEVNGMSANRMLVDVRFWG
jgi:hypothetical protein